MSEHRVDVDYDVWQQEKDFLSRTRRENFFLKIISGSCIFAAVVTFGNHQNPWIVEKVIEKPVPQAIPPIDPDVLSRACTDYNNSHSWGIPYSSEEIKRCYSSPYTQYMSGEDYEKKWDERIRLEVRRKLDIH